MKSKFILSTAAVFSSVLFLSGCATSRSVIDIPIPASGEISKSNGKEVYINSVTDRRLFEIKPSDPSTPSLDPSEEQGDKIERRAIARKRNTYGKGLGDILLPEGKAVNLLMDAAIRQAFIESGYNIINSKEYITNNTYVVDAQVNKFWSWMNPGFWAITLSTEISTDIAIKVNGTVDKQIVNAKASDTYQTGSEDNWLQVMQSALKAYIIELKFKLNHASQKDQK
jgi:hypothetical protein